MLTPIDMKEWEKTCREKTGLGFETFKTVTHCDAETLDALLAASIIVPQALKCLNINKKTLAVLQINTARVLYVNAKITQNIQSSRALLRRS